MPSKLTTIQIHKDARDKLRDYSQKSGKTYSESINQFVQADTSDKKIGPLSRGSGKKQGTIFISSASGNIYTAPKITVQKIKEMLQTPYIRSKIEKRLLTFFPGELIIEVKDPKQQVNKDETDAAINRYMSPDVMLNERIIQAYFDCLCYGEAHYNPYWVRSRTKNEIYIQSFDHYPAHSFDTAPSSANLYGAYSDLLQGVILNDKGEPEYWQRQNPPEIEPIQITNIFVVKDPKDEELAGFSKLIPLCQIIEMVKYVWNTEMQVENRAGAPIFCIKIIDPREADDPICNGVSDVDFANMFIKNANKDHSFVLRGNMEIVNIPFDPKHDNLKTEERLSKIIDDYFNISEMVQKDGATIGDGSNAALDITNQAARGVHRWLLPQFEAVLNQYYWLNGYPEGWAIHLSYELPDPVTLKGKIDQADFLAKYRLGTGDDIIKLLPNVDPKDKKGWQEVFDFWKRWDEAQTKTQPAISPLSTQEETIKKIVNPDAENVDSEEDNPEQFKQMKPHTHLSEGEDEPLDAIAAGMKDELDEELDILAGKILKGLAA